MRNRLKLFFFSVALSVCGGCLHTLPTPDAILTDHDQVNSFTVARSFEEVHSSIVRAAVKCYAMEMKGGIMPAGRNIYVSGVGNVRREIQDDTVKPEESVRITVVVRADAPLPPENYFLRVDIKAASAHSVDVTTYNAKAVRAQRAFHTQVRAWATNDVIDCSGSGPFG